MRRKKKRIEKPKFTLAIGRIYLVTRYHTGDFRARCCDSLLKSVRLKVTDPMSSNLYVDQEIEIPFVYAEFLPAVMEKYQGRGESREEFERDRLAGFGGNPA